VTDIFSDKLAAWRDYTESPWGRLRYLVARETLRREAATLGSRLRILDVGGGDGMDAVPLAVAGHDVTILDQSTGWLAQAERRAAAAGTRLRTVVGDLDTLPPLGEFDMVLCHFVLQYRPPGLDDVARLAGFIRSGGLFSVMLPNPAAAVLRQLILDGPQAALAELDSDTAHAVTFDQAVLKIPADDMEATLARAGLPVVRRYAMRVANDLLASNDLKYDSAYFEDLLRLELALCDQEPFARIGGMYQLIGSKT
jgi:S-adenosylmethionine-dependent methyltransferase